MTRAAIRDQVDRARSEVSDVDGLLRSMSLLIHQTLCYPDQTEATLAICEVAIDALIPRLEGVEVDLHAAWKAMKP